MGNPWTKKNPFMSLWLSAANKAVGTARGQAAGAARRGAASAQTEATRQVLDFWGLSAPKAPARKKPRR